MSNLETAGVPNHIRAIVSLLESLEWAPIQLYEHHYHYLAFGSWVLVLGQRKHRLRFVWDGKESHLSVARAQFADSHSAEVWVELPRFSGRVNSEGAFEQIRTTVSAEYAV